MLLHGHPPAVQCRHARSHFHKAPHRQRLAAGAAKGDEEPVDFDLLAKQLSRGAEDLRRAEAERALRGALGQPGAEQGPAGPAAGRGPFGDESPGRRQEVLRSVGGGGFDASELEATQTLGQLSFVTEAAAEDPLRLQRERREQTAVLAYLARYRSGLPFQDPVTVLLKEFLPRAGAVACNELQVLKRLQGSFPEEKWRAAMVPLAAGGAPLVPLLGYFEAEQSEASSSEAGRNGGEQALWLVYKFERLQPLSYYAANEQLRPGPSLFWSAGTAAAEALKWRCQMVRAICRGVLQALAFCHERGVAHGSLGPGSILLSTFEDRRAQELVVKLDNFGFARMQQLGTSAVEGTPLYPSPASLDAEHPLALAMGEDLRAAGLALLDVIFAALSPEGYERGQGGPGGRPSEALQRLVLEVFPGRMEDFRGHCLQGGDFAGACSLLDEGGQAGWGLLEALLAGRGQAADLLRTNGLVAGT